MNSKEAIKNVAQVPNKFNSNGGTISGAISISGNINTTGEIQHKGTTIIRNNDTSTILSCKKGYMYFRPNGDTDTTGQVTIDLAGNVTAPKFTGALAGNSNTASKLASARTISLTGSVTGSVSFDGSQNVSLSTTTNHTHNYIGPAGSWSTNGGQDLLVYGKRALVGFTNGELHLGYGGDFSSIKCGNGYTIWHTGNFSPRLKWNDSTGRISVDGGANNASVNYADSSWNCSRINGKNITVSQSAPSGPATGDIWISW